MKTPSLNVNTVIDQAKFTSFHWSVLLWCLLIVMFDGYVMTSSFMGSLCQY